MTQPARRGAGTGREGTPSGSGAAGRRFLINVIGVVGLVFGVLAIVAYLLEVHLLDFATAPYSWLRLSGVARFLPPAMVLVACLVASFVLERRGDSG